MAVRTHLSWPWRAAAVARCRVVAGMWWWGFDFGQILGGFNRKEVEARLATLESKTNRTKNGNNRLRIAGQCCHRSVARSLSRDG